MKYLSLEVKDYIGIVTYNKPPVNAIDADVYNEFRMMFDGINIRDDIRVCILRAEGKMFAPGNDVNDLNLLKPTIVEEYLNIVKSGIGAVYGCRVPLIAAVNGAAMGAGMAVAACCDFIIASEKAVFGIPEIKVGIVGAAEFADLMVPRKVVNYMALTGKSLTAKEIEHYGGVLKVVPPDQLMDECMKLANDLMASGPIILRMFKKALQTNLDARLIEKYNVEGAYTTKYCAYDDFNEASKSFLEKRKPVFTGK